MWKLCGESHKKKKKSSATQRGQIVTKHVCQTDVRELLLRISGRSCLKRHGLLKTAKKQTVESLICVVNVNYEWNSLNLEKQ